MRKSMQVAMRLLTYKYLVCELSGAAYATDDAGGQGAKPGRARQRHIESHTA
jgi:hypothetical protein